MAWFVLLSRGGTGGAPAWLHRRGRASEADARPVGRCFAAGGQRVKAEDIKICLYSRSPPPAPAPRMGSARGSGHPENMLHVVEPERPALQPERRAHRAGRIDPAVEAAMGERDVLGGGGEEQRVLADHLAAAERGEADGAGPAGAGMAVPP